MHAVVAPRTGNATLALWYSHVVQHSLAIAIVHGRPTGEPLMNTDQWASEQTLDLLEPSQAVLFHHLLELAAIDQAAANVIKPDGLTLLLQLQERIHVDLSISSGRTHRLHRAFPKRSFSQAANAAIFAEKSCLQEGSHEFSRRAGLDHRRAEHERMEKKGK